MINKISERYLSLIDAEMHATIDSFDEVPREFKTMLEYPMGWVQEDGRPYTKPTGKRIRPLLLLLCCEATGGEIDTAIPAAAAVEILHNFSLVHDDIQDNSDIRHGRPTVWNVWGEAMAINVGDAMFALSYRGIERLSQKSLSAETVLDVWRIYNQTILELTRGQYLDMSFETHDTVSVSDYLSMIRGKTAALVAAVAEIGALIGSQDRSLASEYAQFGLNLGIAFQIHDDILGIWGEPDQTGKSAATDIISRKKSLPVLYGLEHSQALIELYQKPQFDETDIELAIQFLESVDARQFALETETEYYNLSIDAINRAKPIGEAATLLSGLVDWLFQRSH